jgi:O-antigen/teichoic acid export membrane protein
MSSFAWLMRLCPPFVQRRWQRVQRSPVGRRLANGMFWNFMSIVLSRGLGLLVSVVVVRLLGKESFGRLGIVIGTAALFQAFASVGVAITTTKYVSEHRITNPIKAGHIIALSNLTAVVTGVLMAIALAILSPWLASHVLAEPLLTIPLLIVCPTLLLGTFNGVQNGILTGLEAFKTTARLGVLTTVVGAPILAVGVWYGGIPGGAWGLVGQSLVTTVLNQISVRSAMRQAGVWPIYQGCMEQWPVLVHYSLPAFLGGLMVGPVNWACNALLVNQPHGYAEMGIYNATNQWFSAIMFIPSVLAPVLLPMLSERAGVNDRAGSRTILWYAVGGLATVAVPACVVLCLASKPIMALYGPEFSSAWPTMIVVVVTAVLLAIMAPVGNILAASARMWISLSMNLGWAVVFIGFTLLLVRWGAFGLAAARCIAYIFHAVWVSVYAAKLLRSPD